MRKSILPYCSLILLVACGGNADVASEGALTSAAAKAPSSSVLYDEDLRKEPCTLLTADMVATVAQVSVDQVEQRALSAMCLYSWEGGQANIGFIKAYESVEEAASRFEMEHASMTGAEVQDAMQQIGEATKKKLEEDAEAGESVPDSEHVDTVVGGMAGTMGGGITFEAIEGLGDMAAYETTRHETKIMDKTLVSYANSLNVLIGNLKFDVSFALDGEGGEGKMYRDEAVALARLVIDNLPD